jgi:hypothetical protein
LQIVRAQRPEHDVRIAKQLPTTEIPKINIEVNLHLPKARNQGKTHVEDQRLRIEDDSRIEEKPVNQQEIRASLEQSRRIDTILLRAVRTAIDRRRVRHKRDEKIPGQHPQPEQTEPQKVPSSLIILEGK